MENEGCADTDTAEVVDWIDAKEKVVPNVAVGAVEVFCWIG